MPAGSLWLMDIHPKIGQKHGQALAAQIVSQLHIYRGLFADNCKLDWAQVLEIADQFRGTIDALRPDLLEEMRGIADGVGRSDVRLLDIVALNARSEIALGKWDDGCTALAWRLGDSEKQVLAQNWDWRTAVGENLALVSIRPIGKPTIWMVAEVRADAAGNAGPVLTVPAAWHCGQDRFQLGLRGRLPERHTRPAHLDGPPAHTPSATYRTGVRLRQRCHFCDREARWRSVKSAHPHSGYPWSKRSGALAQGCCLPT